MTMLAGASLWSPAVHQGASGVGELALLKIIYASENRIYQVNPDLSGNELLFTWAAETIIGGIAVDHVGQRIFIKGNYTEQVIYINYDGSGETLFRQTTKGYASTFPIATLTISELENLLIFNDTGGSGFFGGSNLVKMSLSGGAPTTIVTDAMCPTYIPELNRVAYLNPVNSSNTYIKDVDLDGSNGRVHSTNNKFASIAWYDASSVFFCGNDGNASLTTTVYDESAENGWFYEFLLQSHQMEMDRVSNHLWVIGMTSGETTLSGLWKFTDPSTFATGSAHGSTVDFEVLPAHRDKVLGLALKYNQPWQAFVTE